MQPIFRWIEAHAKSRPQHVAIISGSNALTYEMLWAQTRAACAWFKSNDVMPGDRVLLSADRRDIHYVPAYFGLHLASAIAVPLVFRSTAAEISRYSDFVSSRLVVFGDKLAEMRAKLASVSEASDIEGELSGPELSDVAEIMFTTGSTGTPKGVTLTHANISASADLIRKFVGHTSSDTEVVTVPLTHSFGLGRLRTMVQVGGTIVLVPGLTFPQLTISALRDQKATGLACVPAGITILLTKAGDSLAALSSQLKYLELGSARLPRELKEKLMAMLPHTRLCMHYGLTEASRSTFMEFHSDLDHLESVGKPSPGVQIAIFSDTSADVPVGELGFIHVKAATVMSRYWNDEKQTEKVLGRGDGWLNTGDLGFVDESDYVHLVGRADDVINTGGVNVQPSDVEEIARRFSGVSDCGCVGAPDPDGVLGSVPMLFVASAEESIDLDELTRFISGHLAADVPTVVVRLVDKIPRSESGKLLRRELRALGSA